MLLIFRLVIYVKCIRCESTIPVNWFSNILADRFLYLELASVFWVFEIKSTSSLTKDILSVNHIEKVH